MDHDAFQVFFEATRGPLQGYLRRVSGDPALAEDMLQESYIRFLNHPPKATGSASQRAYLFTLASNLLRDHWRLERPWSWLPWVRGDGDEDDGPDEPEPACDRPLPDRVIAGRLAVQRGFETLSRRQRSLLWLAHGEGFDHRELARLFRLSEGSVKVLLHRARKKMADSLKENGFHDGDLP
jgi:RNA polymerase sigma-70 factor (ECF subfamily)